MHYAYSREIGFNTQTLSPNRLNYVKNFRSSNISRQFFVNYEVTQKCYFKSQSVCTLNTSVTIKFIQVHNSELSIAVTGK